MKGKRVNDEQIERILAESFTAVFTTMAGFQIEAGKVEEAGFQGEAHIAGAVGFTGTYSGIIYIYSNATFARMVTRSLLGMQDEEIESDNIVNDAMGELTNMVAGNFKTKMEKHGIACTMTIPSVVLGIDFQIEPVTGVRRRSLFFRCNGGEVLTEALIKCTTTDQ